MTHPSLGRIEVSTGTEDELGVLDPNFPQSGKNTKGKKKGSKSLRLLVRINDTVIARQKSLTNTKIDLSDKTLNDQEKRPAHGEYGHQQGILKPLLSIETNWDNTWIRSITVHGQGTVIIVDAPVGSRGAHRQHAMERSRFKRWLYPLLGGVGKGGSAVAVIVLGPLAGRLVDRVWQWLSQYFPDWEINLPSIPWPEFNLSSITLPSIPWPDITLPSWDWPWWVEFLAEYTKVWVPVVIGIGVGIVTIRNHRRSEQTKKQWAEKQIVATDPVCTDIAATLHAPVTKAAHVFRARIAQLAELEGK